ncbi:hypothetical protein QJS10_CPA10g01932 [Acorus calamus]|uniref:Ubiquinol oxidase n=1 Tax=Acorus calamus TaxID=4465 RepID=A0AAV9DXV0_ACOCL|nr:hypothetical protein QJS10_CPA10g01932 [Acorus calamus]
MIDITQDFMYWKLLLEYLILELGGNSLWFDRFLAQHIAIFYYFMIVLMYAISPRMAYHFSECVENHAFTTYDKFLLLQGVNESAIGPIGKELFEREQDDLLSDLKDIPKKACDRRINEFVKRARAAKIHAYIISHLRKEMPAMMGKAKTQQRLIDNLEDEFAKVQREYHLPMGDFPNVDHFKEVLSGYSIDKFEKLKPKLIQSVDDMLGYDIPELLRSFRNPYE